MLLCTYNNIIKLFKYNIIIDKKKINENFLSHIFMPKSTYNVSLLLAIFTNKMLVHYFPTYLFHVRHVYNKIIFKYNQIKLDNEKM